MADRWRVGKGGPSVPALFCVPRLTGLEESAWGDGDEALDHNYYNSIPGKEPPLGGLVDSRLAVTQPCALATLGGPGQVSLHYPVGPEWVSMPLGWMGSGVLGGKRAWHIPGSPCLSCRECHLHGEKPVACPGIWVSPEQVGCAGLMDLGSSEMFYPNKPFCM